MKFFIFLIKKIFFLPFFVFIITYLESSRRLRPSTIGHSLLGGSGLLVLTAKTDPVSKEFSQKVEVGLHRRVQTADR